MQDKTMASNARNILLLTASAFCLSAAGGFLAARTPSGEYLQDSPSQETRVPQGGAGLALKP